MSQLLLALNAGSSSIKFAVYVVEQGQPRLQARGQVEALASAPHFIAQSATGVKLCENFDEPALPGHGHTEAFAQIWRWLLSYAAGEAILAVGHRVTHGGAGYVDPVLIDARVMAALENLIPLAPLHQPHHLAAIQAVTDGSPDLPQVACFDTSFHQGREKVAECFAIPYQLFDRGVRRYGFHGLSYEFIVRRLRELAPDIAEERLIIAHLGSGCSMAAVKAGKSVDTTMSFSALDGLPMGTRCGTIDPGVLLFLMREEGMGLAELEELLYQRSGLLGLSGVSNDLRALHASDDSRAAEAIDCFVYRVNQALGSLAASLGGLDALVFTAGVGENDAEIRRRICEQAAWLGVSLDPVANQHRASELGDCRISAADASPQVWVISTDEEYMIAMHTLAVLA